MPAVLSDANRKAARARAADQYGVKKGDLYLTLEDGSRWGPIACNQHRTHPTRQVTRWTRDAEGRTFSWFEPDLHQTGQEAMSAAPLPLTGVHVPESEDSYPGYQPDCDLCADQAWDTIDHLVRVEMERMRAS